MTWTLPGALLFLLGLLLLLGYFLSKKVFPKEQEKGPKPDGPQGMSCETCGVEGCGGFAKALVRGGQEETPAQEQGLDAACTQARNAHLHEEQKAFVRCQGNGAEAAYLYSGAPSCGAAANMEVRPKLCPDACLGFGDCLHACSEQAIRLKQGIARIDPARCTGCGDCITSCPVGLIGMILPESPGIACKRSHGDQTQSICPDGCTGCGDCVRACPENALVQNAGEVPALLRDRCNGCGICVDACPPGILSLHISPNRKAEPAV